VCGLKHLNLTVTMATFFTLLPRSILGKRKNAEQIAEPDRDVVVIEDLVS